MTVMHPVLNHVNGAVLQCNDIKGMCNCKLFVASDVDEKEANVSPSLGKVLMLFLASYGCRYNFNKFHFFLFFFCARCYRLVVFQRSSDASIEFLLKKSKHLEAGIKLNKL